MHHLNIIYKMIETHQNPPLLLNIKGENQNLFQINLDNSENSTRESHPECENSKCCFDEFSENNRNEQSLFMSPEPSKKKIDYLNKKREKNDKKIFANKNKNKNGKNKLIYKLFSEFKSCGKLYKEFCQFHFIEKNIKNNIYSTTNELASEIRNVFSSIFSNFTNSHIYNKTFIFCENFENIYKKYDNKSLTKKCKNLSDIINKLKRELRQTEINQIQGEYKYNNNNMFLSMNKKTKNKNDNYKNILINKIKKLNTEQKKGILHIIYDNKTKEQFLQNKENKEMEIDINQLSCDKLKQLEKYLNDCINYNESNNASMSCLLQEEEEKEYDILNNDDLSSHLSDDDDDDEE